MQMKHQGVQWCEWLSKPWQRQWLEPWSPVWFRFQEVHTQGNKTTDLGRWSPWSRDNHQELRRRTLCGTRRALCIGVGCDGADSLQEFTIIHLCNLSAYHEWRKFYTKHPSVVVNTYNPREAKAVGYLFVQGKLDYVVSIRQPGLHIKISSQRTKTKNK